MRSNVEDKVKIGKKVLVVVEIAVHGKMVKIDVITVIMNKLTHLFFEQVVHD